jgi:urease accessory protein UreF
MPANDSYARPQPRGWESTPEEVELLSARFAALFRQVGSPDAYEEAVLLPLADGGIQGTKALQDFLHGYLTCVLAPLEMPTISKAHFVSSRGYSRELIALDVAMNGTAMAPALAAASRCTGRIQLERLRPLRDERVVQKYLSAVADGRAAGWHTVVYGLSLAVYSWPVRSALMTYGRATLASLARSAARASAVPDGVGQEILETMFAQLPAAVERTVAGCEKWNGALKAV